MSEVHHPYCPEISSATQFGVCGSSAEEGGSQRAETVTPKASIQELTTDALKAIDSIDYITEHLKQDDLYKKVDTYTHTCILVGR